MPWQRQVADVGLELDPLTGLYVFDTVIVTIQRQSGKTTLVLSIGTDRCLTRPNARAWYTAQTGKDAGEWMREEAIPVLDASPFRGRYKKRLSQGSEGITWAHNGSTFRVFAPLRDGLHGKQSDIVFPDEAWAHNEVKGDELKQAIRPTQATRPGAQVWPMSTAGDAESAYLLSYVELGRASVAAGLNRRVAYFEWGIPDDVDPEDIPAVAEHHPAVGFTITTDALYAARAEMKPGEFARAYGNRWTATAERVIPAEQWSAGKVELEDWTQPTLGLVGLAFEVALDRREASIVAAWRTPTGQLRLDLIDHRDGDHWLAERLVELHGRWRPTAVAYNAIGPAGDIADELERAGVPVMGLQTREYVAACSGLLADVVNERVEHRDQFQLNTAAGAAAKRDVGDGWVWAPRRSAGSIAPVVAGTCARWCFDHRPPPPAKPFIVVR